MKRLTFLFLFISSTGLAQIMPKYSLGLSLLPDYGAGGIYTRHLGHLGIYGSYSHTIMHFSRRLESSQKISAGIKFIYFNKFTPYPAWLSLGTSYNTYESTFKSINNYAAMPFDVQSGFGMMVKSIAVGMRYDIFKNEASVDLSWNIGKQAIKYKLKKHGR